MDSLLFEYNNPSIEDAVPSTGKMQITKLAKRQNMSVLKVRKLLVSAGAFENEKTIQIHKLKSEGKSISEIVEITGYSKSSVNSFLPYSKIIYKMEEVSPNAIRMKRHREKVKSERGDVIYMPALQHAFVPRWERTNIIRAVPRGKLILEQQIEDILETIHGPFEYKGYSHEIIAGWPLPPNHIVLKRGGYISDGSEQKLMDEGFDLEQVGEKYKVVDYNKYLVSNDEIIQMKNFILTCPVCYTEATNSHFSVIMGEKNNMTINMEKDAERICNVRLATLGVNRKHSTDAVLDYFILLSRTLFATKRIILKSKDFACPKGLERELAHLESVLSTGQDYRPYMTKSIFDLSRDDKLLSDWGIIHFHVSDSFSDGGFFADRSNYLLLVMLTQNEALFLQCIPHPKKGNQIQWALRDYLEIVLANWPSVLHPFCVTKNGQRMELTFNPSDSDIAAFRKANITTMFELSDGNIYFGPGQGYASDGTPIIAVSESNRFKRELHYLELLLKEQIDKGNISMHSGELIDAMVLTDFDETIPSFTIGICCQGTDRCTIKIVKEYNSATRRNFYRLCDNE